MENFENLRENLKAGFKNWFRRIKESLEFHEDFSEQLKRVPTSQNIEDYYYDWVKNEWVPKSQMGPSPLKRIDTNINLLLNHNKGLYVGTSNSISLEANKSHQIYYTNEMLVNAVKVIAKTKNISYNSIKLNVFMWKTTELTNQNIELLNDYLYRIEDNYEAVFSFNPTKDFNIGFTNQDTSYDLEIEYSFFYSTSPLPEVNTYECYLNNSSKNFWITRHNKKFNACSVLLFDASNINADINIDSYVTQSQEIEIIDETENTGVTSYYNTFYLPANYDLQITLKNNKASSLYCRVIFFFSNFKPTNLAINGYELAQMMPTNPTCWNSGWILLSYSEYIRVYFDVNENVDITKPIYIVISFTCPSTHVSYPLKRYVGANSYGNSFDINNKEDGTNFTHSVQAGVLEKSLFAFPTAYFSAGQMLSYAFRPFYNNDAYKLSVYKAEWYYTKKIW